MIPVGIDRVLQEFYTYHKAELVLSPLSYTNINKLSPEELVNGLIFLNLFSRKNIAVTPLFITFRQ